MTQDEIIRSPLGREQLVALAREAGVYLTKIGYEFDTDDLCRFAALVAANEKKFWMEQIDVECNEAVLAEREACAKVCDKYAEESSNPMNFAENCAAAIRGRGMDILTQHSQSIGKYNDYP